jgi:hypothetical protein
MYRSQQPPLPQITTAIAVAAFKVHIWCPVDLPLASGVAGETRPLACGSRGQCDHQKMVAHVARHETKTRRKVLGRLFFGAQDAIFRATRTVGMKHRIWRSAEERPPPFPHSPHVSWA